MRLLRQPKVASSYGQGFKDRNPDRVPAIDAVLLGLSVFVWALFGIMTRESQSLASFWPANAFLLGMLIRFPALANGYAWPAAFLGYIAADFLSGGSVQMTVLLTLGNMLGVVTGYALLRPVRPCGKGQVGHFGGECFHRAPQSPGRPAVRQAGCRVISETTGGSGCCRGENRVSRRFV